MKKYNGPWKGIAIGQILAAPFVLAYILSGNPSCERIEEAKKPSTIKQETLDNEVEVPGQKTLDNLVLVKKPVNPKTTDLDSDDDVTLLARLIYGEARGGSDELKKSVAYTVINRAGKHKWWGHTLKEVILKPFQYSCFNSDDPNKDKVMDPLRYERKEIWDECYSIAKEVLENPDKDFIQATHYFDPSIQTPKWAKGKKVKKNIDGVKFYKLNY